MASTTPNIGLTLPTGAEKVSRQIINENNTKIDTAIGGTAGRELLGYKENGDTASQAISDGSFVVWKGSLYKANGNISQGATLSALNLTAVPSGGFNDLQGQVDSLNDSIANMQFVRVTQAVTIPANSQITVQIGSFKPTGKSLVGISQVRLGEYALPYYNSANNTFTWVATVSNTEIIIKNTSSNWDNYTLSAVCMYA